MTNTTETKLKKKEFVGKDGRVWNEEELKNLLKLNEKAAVKAMMLIYDYQTNDEKNVEDTKYHNNVGFTGSDGKKLTGMSNFYKNRGFLTEKQIKVILKRMPKYAGQVIRIMKGEQ